ncbi:MAG: hypothetical protein JXQ90_12180 [Cyclobacteriaceae bacterium]
MKEITKIISIVILAITFGGFTRCTFDQIPPEPVLVPDSVSFSVDVVPIFDMSCNSAGCHNTGGVAPDLTADNSWVNLVYFAFVDTAAPDESILMKKITAPGTMAQFVTDQEHAVILQWITQGAPNN